MVSSARFGATLFEAGLRSVLRRTAVAAFLVAPPALAAPDPPEVFVLATLYGRHATTPAYNHATLRSLILRVAPSAVVLDVSPAELRDRKVHPSKGEYPEVIFPLVEERRYRAYAGEPDEPVFSEVVKGLSEALKNFRERTPEAAEADKAYGEASFRALAEIWQSPADVNGSLTDRVLAARRAVQDRLAGAAVADAWRRWNSHLLDVVLRAARENPGRRILVLVGVENTPAIRADLARERGLTLVDMETGLRDAAPPAAAADPPSKP